MRCEHENGGHSDGMSCEFAESYTGSNIGPKRAPTFEHVTMRADEAMRKDPSFYGLTTAQAIEYLNDDGETTPDYVADWRERSQKMHEEMQKHAAAALLSGTSFLSVPKEESIGTLRERMYNATMHYARGFHNSIRGGETLTQWFVRIAPSLTMKTAGWNFFQFLKVNVSMATGIDVDELDKLIDNAKAASDPNAPYPPPVPQHVQRARASVPPHANPTPPVWDPRPPRVTPAAEKDSLLNPAPKGFEGSRKLPYDSDYD